MSMTNRILAFTPASRLQRLLVLATFALLGSGFAVHARAQSEAPANDPPGRVARLSDVSGQVWLNSPDDNEWIAVDRNRPLTTGDRLATDNDARAEITLGTTTLRLDAATEIEVVQLDDSVYRIHLQSGSVAARLRSPQALGEFALETDEGQFRVQAVGRYRIDRSDQGSDLTVYSGQAIYEAGNSALPLTAGQHAQFWLDASGTPQYNMVEPSRDDFAAWNDERDRAENRPVAAPRYVSPEMTGADDLDRYGQWEHSADYGPLWAPGGVAADWAPYSNGHWAWVRPWGWTWVDAAPWGFAPFHYGRWVNYRNHWCWAPGTYVARPVYAPALVAWIGGPRVGVSLSIGAGGPPVGWFPLAPHEVYVPSYRSSPRYLREVNFSHVSNVGRITTIVNNVNGAADHREFANRRFPNAVTVVPAGVLTARQPVGPAAARFRGDPQVRSFVAEARPGSAMIAAPVPTPIARPRLPGGPAATRPPLQGRAPGGFAGRPSRDEERPAAGAARPLPPAHSNTEAIQRPPMRGRILRSEVEAATPRVLSAPTTLQRGTTPLEAARPQVAPRGEPRGERGVGRPGEPRGVEAQPRAPTRPVEAVRPVEAARPEQPQRAVEPKRVAPEQVQRTDSPRREERHDERREPKEQPK